MIIFIDKFNVFTKTSNDAMNNIRKIVVVIIYDANKYVQTLSNKPRLKHNFLQPSLHL